MRQPLMMITGLITEIKSPANMWWSGKSAGNYIIDSSSITIFIIKNAVTIMIKAAIHYSAAFDASTMTIVIIIIIIISKALQIKSFDKLDKLK